MTPKDPGVWNWVDTAGLHTGGFLLRWQGLADKTAAPDTAVKQLRVVKLKELKAALPPETVWVTPEQRKRQIADRIATFARRIAN